MDTIRILLVDTVIVTVTVNRGHQRVLFNQGQTLPASYFDNSQYS